MGGVSRRSLLIGAVGAATVGAGVATTAALTGRPDLRDDPTGRAAFRDDLTDAPDGPLAGREADSGQRWIVFGDNRPGGGQPPTVAGGGFGPPPGHRVDRRAAAAGYATIPALDGPVVRIGAEFRWDASTAPWSGLALLASPTPHLAPADRGGSHLHLGVSPSTLGYSVWERGIRNFTDIAPVGRYRTLHTLREPMAADGATVHHVEVEIDRGESTAAVTVNDNEPVVWRSPLIGAVDARHPVWEYYTVPGGTNLPRFTRVWAD